MPEEICPQPKTFDLVHSPLAGVTLIDASAGTGKTYTICGLILRLLLEKNLTIEQILVVTYTEAATEDLRDRIRQKLRQALDVVNNNQAGGDAFLQQYLAGVSDRRTAALRLADALRSFDAAAIFTIHGFCHRLLLENSFESNILFDTELVVDDSPLVKEILEDFNRRVMAQASRLFSRYAADKLTPDALYDFLAPCLPHPFLRFIPAIEFDSAWRHLAEGETEFIRRYRDVCQAWPAARQEVLADLFESPALKRNIYRLKSMPQLISSMDDMAASCRPDPYLFEYFSLFTAARIIAATKKNNSPNILPFYQHCEALQQAAETLLAGYDRCLLALKKRLLDTFNHELNSRKEKKNVFSFDDLLRRLHAAFSGPGGAPFARAVAEKYPAALVDEFQDTDPLQFEIFQAIYHEHSLLFLIGDPKQAIYSFRGADIFTYMDAAAAAPAHHTLGVNYRSTPLLIKAVNAVFSQARNPFIFKAIGFQPVAAAPQHVAEQLTVDGRQEPPFILWYLDRADASEAAPPAAGAKNPAITKSAARSLIVSRVAAEIARLLQLAAAGRICFSDRRLLPKDIAVLVRTNDEARRMQQALTGWEIPSVLHSGDDLFASEEAWEMSLLLNGIAAPASIRRVKTAALTRFIGLPPEVVHRMQDDTPDSEALIEQWLSTFRRYHDAWHRYGFIRMFWAVMRQNRVRQRLLASENGERRLTNILHLAEILHQETVNRGLNMAALLAYLHERLAGAGDGNTEHQLRLESDEDRVKIVTIHKAKGLEYSVVFCPFSWEGTRLNARKGCLFHQPAEDGGTALVLDAGSDDLDKHLQQARLEEMAENLRLLYVALTRAVHRCYLVWGPISGAETSAPAYLLHQAPAAAAAGSCACDTDSGLLQETADRFAGLSDGEILADLRHLAAAAENSIAIRTGGVQVETTRSAGGENIMALRCRTFTADLVADWKISSFSSLVADRPAPSDTGSPILREMAADRDDNGAAAPTASLPTDRQTAALDIHSLPPGAKSGILLHEILEQADFSNEQPVPERLINEKLLHFGYETAWYPVIARLLTDVAGVPLLPAGIDLQLAGIPRENCLAELEFYFPLARIRPDDLHRIFRAAGLQRSTAAAESPELRLEKLTFAPTRGFMRGFIDLVFASDNRFYLVDWKSNYLGPGPGDYRRDKLFDSILAGYYFLQYHIYSLALHLYLRQRLPAYSYESHFGGVFYIYLRGVNRDLGPDYGIYHDLPAGSTIELLETKLLAGSGR